jgi:hypothetical protein
MTARHSCKCKQQQKGDKAVDDKMHSHIAMNQAQIAQVNGSKGTSLTSVVLPVAAAASA